MRKFTIDAGSSSIGWCITENGKLIKKGVVTFDSGMVKGTSGYVSPTRERRENRTKRNTIRAKKYRKWELLEILLEEYVPLNKTELEIWAKYKRGRKNKFPENEKFLKWIACDFTYERDKKYKNPYQLRVAALNEKLSKHEFGRALYHLIQRRGYKDIGETDKETEKQIARRGESGFQKALDENRTIAEALVNEFLAKNERARNQYPYRDEYKNELEQICKKQGYDISKYDDKAGSYKDAFVKKLWKSIIWQRDLRTQKGNIGKCTLEPNKLRCPISHPVFEIFRTWQFINTIKYYDENGEKQFLPFEFKEQLYAELFLKKDSNFEFEDIRKFLDGKFKKYQRYNYPMDKNGKYDTSVAGMPVCKGLIDVFKEQARKAIDSIETQNRTQKNKGGGFGGASAIIATYSIFDLWHILFAFDAKTAKDKNFPETFAKEKLHITDEKQIRKFVKLKDKFQQGYADLSLKAMCKIIPFLKDGYLYNEAVVLAKMPEVLGENWDTEKSTILAAIKRANNVYEWNKTIINIVNSLIDKYKGLKDEDKFAYKDYRYVLSDYDVREIQTACENEFGEKSWAERHDKDEILNNVREQYQDFFYDEKRSYRKCPSLAEIFTERLRELHLKIDVRKLYHHSNLNNKYLEKCRIENEKPLLPTVKNEYGFEVEILPPAIIDSIKNPMFNKSMSILRKLTNELILKGEIDKETEVVIELARELNDNNKRVAIERYQKERRDNRNKYREFLKEFSEKENHNINVEESLPVFELWTEQIFEEIEDENKQKVPNVNRKEILREKDSIKRYELWMEQKGVCMYTGKMISITKLFSNEIDIEHTIPRSLLPDDTLANQTVCYAWYNRNKKKNQIPIQCLNYFNDVDDWGTRIESRLNNWRKTRDHYKEQYEKKLKSGGNEDEDKKNKRIQEKHYYKLHYDYWKDKLERFEAEEVRDSWVRRQLVDTQMTGKYAREFLKTYFMKVAVQKGSTTAAFRKIFGVQEENEMKNRDWHTQHIGDALMLALIPTNSSYRERILKEYYRYLEEDRRSDIKEIKKREFPQYANIQSLIKEIETSTLVFNYKKDKILLQTGKTVRKRGMKQYLKDKSGKFVLDENNNKILLKAKGDTIRSGLFAQTYLGKIRDVERDENGQPRRDNGDWKYKKGKDEFKYVVRKPIRDVLGKIDDIVDPVIREIVRKQKNNSEIRDYNGKIIRHVRIKTNAGKEVKERLNYRSEHEYKNKFYSESGSVPYAIFVQQFNDDGVKRDMIPVASYEIAKLYKQAGRFDIEKYINEFQPQYKDWNKKLLKVGQKVFVLKEDLEYEKRYNVDFQKNRLYVITKFTEGSIWLKYHLSALSEKEIKNAVSLIKDELLSIYEQKYNILPVIEDLTIIDNRLRKEDFENRKYRFDTIDNSFRLKRLSDTIGIEKTKEIKEELDKFKVRPSNIEIEGQTYLLKMSKEYWNYLVEGEDFEMNMDGTVTFKE